MADSDTSSDQKTEEPTPRRLEKALEEGQIAFSSELIGGVVVLAGVFFFFLFGRWFFNSVLSATRERLMFFEPMILEKETLLLALRRNLLQMGSACVGLMAVVVVLVILAGSFQTGLNLSFKPLELKWNKLSPMTGLKRIFSSRAITRGLVAISKAAAIIVSTWFLTRTRMHQVANSSALTLEQAVDLACELILVIGFATAVLMVLIGIGDYAFQRWKQHQELRMSKQEVRDENKEIEGDPLVKARIRRLQNERVRSRMLEDVQRASVVVTNPTHFAVALRYDPEEGDAPVVVAKGKDHLAFKIIDIAKEHGVPVVERKPLARFMYANVDIGQPIPFELYQAVAEILNFIRRAGSSAA